MWPKWIALISWPELRIGSLVRGGLRRIKNKLAEHSENRLRKRIAALEKEKDTLMKYLASDKRLYLEIFRAILGSLVLICFGLFLLAMRWLMGENMNLYPSPLYSRFHIDHLVRMLSTFAALVFLVGALGPLEAIFISSWDSRGKIETLIAGLDREISDLNRHLKALTSQ
jgi:hypothetical protein